MTATLRYKTETTSLSTMQTIDLFILYTGMTFSVIIVRLSLHSEWHLLW